MNKQEFIAELSRLLKVKPEDKQSILEEYENYFQEALSTGELESDIIASLETPEQIAQNANSELGVDPKQDFEVNDRQESIKDKYERFIDSEFFDNLEKDIDKAVSASEEAVKKAAKTIDKTVRSIDFKGILDKVMDTVDKVVDKAASFDVKGRMDDVAMRFDQSKVQTFAYSQASLTLTLDDPNSESMVVELVPGQQQIMVKYLPTNLKCEMNLNESSLSVSVEATSIKFAERKRMRIYIPESIKDLQVTTNCPVTFNDVDVNVQIDSGNAPILIKKMMSDKVSIKADNGPVVLKHSKIDRLIANIEQAPLTGKDLRCEHLELHQKNGPLSLKDLRLDELWVTGGNGPKSIKDVVAKTITLQVSGGPLSLSDVSAGKISGDISGTLYHSSDCKFEENTLVKS